MIECSLRKRPAIHVGEVGLFPNDPTAEEDFGHVAMGTDVWSRLSSLKSLALLRFIWALAQNVAENTDADGDKDDMMESLKIAVRFARFRVDPRTGQTFVATKSLATASNETLRRVSARMVHVVCHDIIPGMNENALRAEIEQMVGATIRPERKRKGRAA